MASAAMQRARRSRGPKRSERLPGQLLNRRTMKWEYPPGYKGAKIKTISRRMKVLKPIKGLSALATKITARKAELRKAIKSKTTAIKPQKEALISEQVSKAKRIPYIIGGVLVAVYVLFKKGRKGGKK